MSRTQTEFAAMFRTLPAGEVGTATLAIVALARLLIEKAKEEKRILATADAFLFAAQMHPNQDQMMEWHARRHHQTKAAFSLQVNFFRDALHLPRLAGAKRAYARQLYSAVQKKLHAKRTKKMGRRTTREKQTETEFVFTAATDLNRAIERARETLLGSQTSCHLLAMRLRPVVEFHNEVTKHASQSP